MKFNLQQVIKNNSMWNIKVNGGKCGVVKVEKMGSSKMRAMNR